MKKINSFSIENWDGLNEVLRSESLILAEYELSDCKKQLLIEINQQHGLLLIVLRVNVWYRGVFKWYHVMPVYFLGEMTMLYNHIDPNLPSTWRGLVLDKKLWNKLQKKYPDLRIGD